MNPFRFRRLAAAFGLAAAFAAPGAFAQGSYPNQPIRIVVPFSAGGVVDSIARIVGDKLSARYGQPVLVENRTGAGGAIGTDYASKAAPDGYTLLCVSPGHSVLPSLMKNLSWDPVKDFRAVEGFGIISNVIVVPPNVQAKTMKEFLDLARNSSTPLSYASAGIGTSNHLSGELLAQQANVKLSHIPYRGQPDALNDLLGGRVSMMPLTAALARSHIQAGKLRPLAVTTAKRSSALPDVPTVAEAANLPDYAVGTWFGLVAPAKTPDPIVQKLSADIEEVLKMPEVKTKLDALGLELTPQGPAEFDAFIKSEVAKWSKVIKQAGIEPQ